MKIKTYNQEGKESGEIVVPKEIFGVDLNSDLVHQVVVSQLSNRRRTLADTKDRGEVSGGGKKPWRQKGTGRARHGSIRSPIWIGGGVSFGPTKERNFKKKINKKMRRLALFMVLSAKAKENKLIVLDSFDFEKPKTKLIAQMLKNLPVKKHSCLIGLGKNEKEIYRIARNLSRLKAREVRNLNVLDLVSFQYFLITKEGIKDLKEIFLKD